VRVWVGVHSCVSHPPGCWVFRLSLLVWAFPSITCPAALPPPPPPPYFPSTVPSGFEKPSAIQQRAIVPMIKGRDLIAQSQSGTGKTAVFSIGILQTLDLSTTETQAIGEGQLCPCTSVCGVCVCGRGGGGGSSSVHANSSHTPPTNLHSCRSV
jgi:hypothetical protein